MKPLATGGISGQDLQRIKNNIKRSKFATLELSTEKAFLKRILVGWCRLTLSNPC